MRGTPGRLAPLLLILLLLLPGALAATPVRHDNYGDTVATDEALRQVALTVLNGGDRALQALTAEDETEAAATIPAQGEQVERLRLLLGFAGKASSAAGAARYLDAASPYHNATILTVYYVSQFYRERNPAEVQARLREALDALDSLESTLARYDGLGMSTTEVRASVKTLRDHIVTYVLPLLGNDGSGGLLFFVDLAPRTVPLGETVRVFGYALSPTSKETSRIAIALDGTKVTTVQATPSGLFEADVPIPMNASFLGAHTVRATATLNGTPPQTVSVPFTAVKVPTFLSFLGVPDRTPPGRAIPLDAHLRSGRGPLEGQPLAFALDAAEAQSATTNARGVASWTIPPFEREGQHSLKVTYPGSATHEGTSATFTLTIATGVLAEDTTSLADYAALLVALALAAAAGWTWYRYRKRRARGHGEGSSGPAPPLAAEPEAPLPPHARAAIIALYHRLLKRAARRGVDPASKTPREIARHLVRLGATPAKINTATRVFEEVRYGNEPVAEEHVAPFKEATEDTSREVGA